MIVKIMGEAGSFDLIGRVKRCSFQRNPSASSAFVQHDNGETEQIQIKSSAFVLSDDGKTIDQFHSSRN